MQSRDVNGAFLTPLSYHHISEFSNSKCSETMCSRPVGEAHMKSSDCACNWLLQKAYVKPCERQKLLGRAVNWFKNTDASAVAVLKILPAAPADSYTTTCGGVAERVNKRASFKWII